MTNRTAAIITIAWLVFEGFPEISNCLGFKTNPLFAQKRSTNLHRGFLLLENAVKWLRPSDVNKMALAEFYDIVDLRDMTAKITQFPKTKAILLCPETE